MVGREWARDCETGDREWQTPEGKHERRRTHSTVNLPCLPAAQVRVYYLDRPTHRAERMACVGPEASHNRQSSP